MRPYKNWLIWNLKGRPYHLIDGLEPVYDQLSPKARVQFRKRSNDLRRTLKISLVVLVILYLGLIASAIAWITRFVGVSNKAVGLVETLTEWTSGFSVVFLVVLLVVRRRLGQLEADLVAICITRGAYATQQEKDRQE